MGDGEEAGDGMMRGWKGGEAGENVFDLMACMVEIMNNTEC